MAKSKIGFHYSVGGAKDGIGGWIANANQQGIPVGLKGVDDAGLCFEAQSNSINYLIYRVSTAGQDNGIEYDVPGYTKDPTIAALEHFNKTVAKWPPELDKNIVWMEPINEPRAKLNPGDIQWENMHPVNWLGWFMSEYAMIANAQGFKVCGPSFNSGEPEVFTTNDYEQPGMLAYLDYCADNPDKAALSLHEYIWDKPAPQYPQLWGRFEAAIAAADNNNIPRTFNIFVTEFGYSPRNAPKYPDVSPDLDKYNQITARFPQVRFAAAWTLQNGYSPVDSQVITWIDYPIDKEFDEGQQPAKTHIEFGGTLPGNTGEPDMDIRSFENGWETLTNRLQRPNDFTLSVIAANNSLRYSGGSGKATGTVEAKHLECGKTLPASQCADGTDPLALDGNFTYKIQAVAMASGTSLKTTFQGTGRKRITVPINVHWQQDVPNEANDVYVAVLMNGKLIKLLQHPELQDRTWHYVVGEEDGPGNG